uniref:Transposase n=1 Tax=Candidatus Kentrum sp. TC TaxID=2126339 RepID=A0A450YXJ7_9GAMM|nr:MAG: hypothetical protein BECKTC1821D_GA0114238_10295 [Candidatus Kentron sp. TC]
MDPEFETAYQDKATVLKGVTNEAQATQQRVQGKGSAVRIIGIEFTGMGHTVRLIAPQLVKRFVKSNNKNDALDAEAICFTNTQSRIISFEADFR